jgi:hypothetical protein
MDVDNICVLHSRALDKMILRDDSCLHKPR